MSEFVELTDYTDRSYLNYSMYVILERALPHVADGMKPVQRRLVYAMHQLGLTKQAKYKKSARTIGDVLGKYHPHGDAACYEAMVRMAQSFSLRYPLVDGQGNWGSQDNPDSFAAMRYTEARLSEYAPLLLRDLPYEAVDFKANFDGTMQEPELLPAELPFALINGASGVAVGMACDIPPHNMSEVIDALVELLDKPKGGCESDTHDSELNAVMQHIKGPDFATTARIISSAEKLREIYATGYGQIKARARYEVDGRDIIITDLPMNVSGEDTIARIAETVQSKKITAVENIMDSSDRQTPVRIVVRLKKSAAEQAEKVMGFLFRHTDMEKSYKVNMNMIGMDGLPEVKNLPEILHEWLDFRVQTVRRRSEYQLAKVKDKLHVTEGLLTAFLNLDEVIRIIRSEDKPKQPLMEALGLTDQQAQAVLDTRLGNLARLEEMELKRRYEELQNEEQRLESLLSSEGSIRMRIREELMEVREQFADARRSPVSEPDQISEVEVDARELAPSEPVRVVLSKNGLVRAGKGHSLDVSTLQYKSNDGPLDYCDSETSREVSLVDNQGRVYCIEAGGLPSAKSYGDPVTKWLTVTEIWTSIP